MEREKGVLAKQMKLWKIKRELRRLVHQLINLPRSLAGSVDLLLAPARRRRHQAQFASRVRMHDGICPAHRKVAIYLIFQPQGLAQSSLALCRDLVAQGYAPFVVSNAPLSDEDCDALAATTWKIMQRPNFGYDFGGYQDALFSLKKLHSDLDAVIVMNDSVWLKLDHTLITRLEAAQGQVVGLVQESKLRRDRQDRIHVDLQNLQSYFYLFHRGAWQHKAFWGFWHDYKMVSNKKRTIKAGEIGLTRHLRATHIPHQALISKSQFLDRITEKDSDYLAFVLRYAIYNDPQLTAARDGLMAQPATSAAWRAAALAHIRQTLVQEPLNGSFWVAACDLFGVTLIKKSKDPQPQRVRRAFLAAQRDGAISLPPQTAHEIAQSVSDA